MLDWLRRLVALIAIQPVVFSFFLDVCRALSESNICSSVLGVACLEESVTYSDWSRASPLLGRAP